MYIKKIWISSSGDPPASSCPGPTSGTVGDCSRGQQSDSETSLGLFHADQTQFNEETTENVQDVIKNVSIPIILVCILCRSVTAEFNQLWTSVKSTRETEVHTHGFVRYVAVDTGGIKNLTRIAGFSTRLSESGADPPQGFYVCICICRTANRKALSLTWPPISPVRWLIL